VEDCSACHAAHEFRVDGQDCLACHQDIFEDEGFPVPPAGGVGGAGSLGGTDSMAGAGRASGVAGAGGASSLRGPAGGVRFAALEPTPAPPPPGSFLHAALPDARAAPQERPAIGSGQLLFRHTDHRDVTCAACHDSEERHGAVIVRGIADCRGCHHTEPVATTCRSCHTGAALTGRGLAVTRTLELSVGEPKRRTLDFEHADHESASCVTCHREGLRRPFDPQSCNTCHEEHHRPTATCVTCHAPSPATAHDVQSHLGCTGAGCHTDLPFDGVPRQRDACLVCHQDLGDHQPGRDCVACHALPAPVRGALP
jgi:hypothetical protein